MFLEIRAALVILSALTASRRASTESIKRNVKAAGVPRRLESLAKHSPQFVDFGQKTIGSLRSSVIEQPGGVDRVT